MVDTGGEPITNQIITQAYVANGPGVYRVQPFSITVNGVTVLSEGTVLLVRPTITSPFGGTGTTASVKIPTESGAAFLTLRSGKSAVFVGEGFAMRLSLFVSDTYPFELRFDGVDAQLPAVLKQLRPTNVWEEDAGISELKGQPVVVNGRPFREYVIFQGVFFPLSVGSIEIPTLKLTLVRARQENRAPDKSVPTKPAADLVEPVTFQTSPLTVIVRPLPPHPLRGQVAVGRFRLVESIDRTAVPVGKSARYSVRIEGEGNIASLQPPLISELGSQSAIGAATPVEALPAGTTQQIDRTGEEIVGSKTFTYFLVPRRAGQVPLSGVFGFVYFDPLTARYDTLRPQTTLRVAETGATSAVEATIPSPGLSNTGDALYANLNQMSSVDKPLNLVALTRAVANVLLVLMILGMIFVFFRK